MPHTIHHLVLKMSVISVLSPGEWTTRGQDPYHSHHNLQVTQGTQLYHGWGRGDNSFVNSNTRSSRRSSHMRTFYSGQCSHWGRKKTFFYLGDQSTLMSYDLFKISGSKWNGILYISLYISFAMSRQVFGFIFALV